LGVTPMLGPGFAANAGGPGRPNLIVLTHALWNRFGADPAIVVAHVRLQGNAYTVSGVLPPTFSCVRNDALRAPQRIDAFITFALDLASQASDGGNFSALLRARPGASQEAVASVVDAAGRTIDARDFNSRGLK